MYYKEDWDIAKKRFEALWNCEIIDRCCISVTSPRKNCENYFKSPEYLTSYNRGGMLTSKYMSDPQKVLVEKTKVFENTFYGGEAFPQIWLNYGPAGHAAYFDAPCHVGDITTWYDKIIDDWNTNDIVFNKDNQILKWQIEMAKYLSTNGVGKYLVSTPDNSGSLDALATLRGTEELLMDMLMEPELVKQKLDKVIDAWKYVDNIMYDICKECNDGSTIGWLSIWANGKFSQLQSDISVMLSNETFKEFAVPELKESADFQDFNLYHLDGIEQIRHLDDIISIDKIKMIQWVSVAGQPSYLEYLHVFKKIQNNNMAVLINDVNPKDIPVLLENLSPKGLLIMTSADSQDEAEKIIKDVDKLSCSKK